jgi:mRNA interferase MazF
VIFNQFDVVISSFPYVEIPGGVRRPCLILSNYEGFGDKTGIGLAAMITMAKRSSWPHDILVSDYSEAGLREPCYIRMKFSAVAFERIEKKIGTLGLDDRAAVRHALRSVLAGAI